MLSTMRSMFSTVQSKIPVVHLIGSKLIRYSLIGGSIWIAQHQWKKHKEHPNQTIFQTAAYENWGNVMEQLSENLIHWEYIMQSDPITDVKLMEDGKYARLNIWFAGSQMEDGKYARLNIWFDGSQIVEEVISEELKPTFQVAQLVLEKKTIKPIEWFAWLYHQKKYSNDPKIHEIINNELVKMAIRNVAHLKHGLQKAQNYFHDESRIELFCKILIFGLTYVCKNPHIRIPLMVFTSLCILFHGNFYKNIRAVLRQYDSEDDHIDSETFERIRDYFEEEYD